MKYVLLLFGGVVLGGVAGAQLPNNINLSNTSLFEGEPYIAVNPANPNIVIVAWMAFDASTGYRISIRTSVSFDGGATWGHEFVQPHFSPTWGSADVSMAFRPNGTVYLSYIDYSQAADSGGVYVTHSADGGMTWSAPVRVWDASTEDPTKMPLDRPWLVVDNSGTATDGTMYITTKPAPWILPPNRPYLKVSQDSGQTWSTFRYVDTTGYLVGNTISAPMAAPAIAADGALCLAYPSYLPSQSIYAKLLLAKSYNKGAGFQYTDVVVNPTSVGPNGPYKLGYKLETDPSDPNLMAFGGVGATYGDPDIFVYTSSDGGNTWGSAVRVNDDSIGNGKAQDMVWLSYAANGDIVAVWRDRRNGADTGFAQPSDTYCALSRDSGRTFMPNIRLSNMTAPFDTVLSHNGNDFMGCKLIDDTIYAAWSDIRSGYLNIYFAKISVYTGTSTGVVTVNSKALLTVYPNPASDKLYVSVAGEEQEEINLSLLNEKGQMVYQTETNAGTSPRAINVSSFPAGVYLIRASEGNKEIGTEKVVISK